MSSVHTATTRSTYSLPSFASTFSKSPNMSSASHALPPIQTLAPTEEHSAASSVAAAAAASKKRPRPTRDGDESPSGSDHGLPPPQQPVRVKEEQDELADSPRPMHANVSPPHDAGGNGNGGSGAGSGGGHQLSPSINEPPHPKKRRTATSNVRQNSNFNVDSADSGHSTPISPSVPAGHLTHRTDRELLEQRRGSIHDHLSPYTGGPSANTQTPKTSFPESSQSGQPPSIRESPNLTARRPTSSAPAAAGITSPPPPTAGGSPLHNPLPSILPALPNSFSGRRAGPQGGIRRKPADLHIQPRDARTVRELRPTIQSAPAFPRAGQEPGTFPVNVTLPTVPSTLGVPPTIRRTAAAVPPTPTRLTLRPTGPSAGGSNNVTGPMPSISGRSPPVPIAASLVPPTPTTLRQPGYAAEKGAFLAPFETFYDSLADARELKQWLHEQVQRAQQLGTALQTQQDRLEDAVGAAVERAMAGQREEVHRLQARVAELENALRVRDYPAPSSSLRGPANGASPTSGKAHESYTYPPVERHQGLPPPPPSAGTRPVLNRRISSSPHQGYDSRTASPPYDPRRLSAVSATRFEPPPPPQQQQGGVRSGPSESPVGSGRHLAPLPHLSSSSRGSGGARNFYPGEQPSLSRHHSGTIPEHGPLPDSSFSSSRLHPPRMLSDDQPIRGRPRSHSTAG